MWHKIRVQFNFLPVDIQFPQHCLLKRLSVSVLCIFGALIEDLIVMDLFLCSLFCSSLHVYLYGRTSLRRIRFQFSSVQFSRSVVSDSLRPHEPQHARSLSITNSWSLPKPMCIESVMPSSHLIFCHPLLLLPSVFSQHQGLFK